MIRGMGFYRDGVWTERGNPMAGEAVWEKSIAQRLQAMIDEAAADPRAFIWLGLVQPTDPEMRAVADLFDLDWLLAEDAMNPRQRTKLDIRPDYDFVVMKALAYVEETSDVETGQISAFIGESFIITVRLGHAVDLAPVRSRLEHRPDLLLHGTGAVLYSLVDQVVDGYLDVADEINIDIENLEEATFSPEPSDPQDVYQLKRENLELRRAVLPLIRVADELATSSSLRLPAIFDPLVDDVRDHLARARDSADTNDDLLMALLMAATARQDLQQNSDMRKISAWVAIAAVPTAIAAIYGMNFEHMPELNWSWGYPSVLLLMAGVCGLLYRGFKRSGWL